MSEEKPGREPLLARWSRLKREAAAAPPPPAEEAAPQAQAEPVALPPLESLTPESDFSPFMQRGVRPELRQAALKKLFSDPHFNVMDGLDIYIDDYTKPDPIAASLVSELAQFRNLDGLQPETPSEDVSSVGTPVADVCAPATEALAERPAVGVPEPEKAVSDDAPGASGRLDTKSRIEQGIDQFVPAATTRLSDFASKG
jgi:hypothetical protein